MRRWIYFIVLAMIWGSSFLLIKQSVGAFGALPLVTFRTGIAGVCFVITLAVLRKPIPTDARTLGHLAVVGLLNTAVPFVLITWGETRIDSGLAGVLNSTVPLFSVFMAHFLLRDDKLNIGKVIGVITGFAGVLVLTLRSLDPTANNPIEGQLAVMLATLSYAFSAIYIRRNLRHVDGMVVAGTTITLGAVFVFILTALSGVAYPNLSTLPFSLIAPVLVLGVVNTFIAYLLFFNLLVTWGASRTTMVTYCMPPISLALGVLFGNEIFDWRLVLGALLIVSGVLVANFWRQWISRSRPAVA